MTGTRIRHGMVILVVLALGLSVATPAMAGPDDTTTGGTLGGGLDGASTNSTFDSGGSSSSDTTHDSGSSGGGTFSDDSGSDTGSSDSGSDTSSTDSGSDTGSSDSGSGAFSDDDSGSSDGGAFSDDDSGSTDSGGSGGEDVPLSLAERTDALGGMDLGDISSEDLSERMSETDLVDVDATTEETTGTTSYEIEVVEVSPSTEPVLAIVASGDTTTSAASTVDSLSNTYDTVAAELTSGSSSSTDATADTAQIRADTSPATPALEGPAAVEPRRDGSGGDGDGGDGGVQPPQNALGARVPTDDLPGGPTGTGAALGVLGLAAAAVARQTGAFGGLTTGMANTMGTAAASMPGTSYLDRLVRMLAPFRYSRYDDSDPLEHEARDAMFEVVEESPGTYLSEIAERADIPLSTARHHIRVLEREDLVSGAKVRGKRRFYPAYTEGVELAAAMNDDSTAAVIDALSRLGAASVSDLAEELGKDPSTVTHHVQRLEEDDVVIRERDGRAVMNKLSAAARTALEPEEAPAEGPTAGEAMASD